MIKKLLASQPFENAAGRMALARIVYALFFLFFLSYTDISELAGAPDLMWRNPWAGLMGSKILLHLLTPALVFLLVLLALGVFTRLITFLLLIVAGYWVIAHQAFNGYDQIINILMFYVPLVGLFSQWGCLYSVDAWRSDNPPDPSDSHWHYAWAIYMILAILSVLFFTAGWYKIFISGTLTVNPQGWWPDSEILARHMHNKPMRSWLDNGSPVFAPSIWLGQLPPFTVFMQYFTLFFELTFPLVLVTSLVYAVYTRLPPFFHIGNAMFLGIPFITVLSAYILIVDWQWLKEDLSLPIPEQFKLSPLKAAAIAALVTALWVTTPFMHWLFGLGGFFDGNRGIWLLVLVGMLFVYWRRWRAWRARKSRA